MIEKLNEKILILEGRIHQHENIIEGLENRSKEKREELDLRLEIIHETKPIKNEAKIPIITYPDTLFQDITKPNDLYKRLDEDISKFTALVKSINESEILTRESLINDIKRSLIKLNPDADIITYGSYATNTWFTFSGIDLSIVSKDNIIFDKLKAELKDYKWVSNITIAKDSLIIQCNIQPSLINVHIRNQGLNDNNLKFVNVVRNYNKSLPFFSELTILLKYIFQISELNDPNTVSIFITNRKV